MPSPPRIGVASRVFSLVAAGVAGSLGCGGAAVHASTASASPARASAQPSVSLDEVLGPDGATRTTAQLAEVARLFRTIERDAAAWYRVNGGATLEGRQSINTRLLRFMIESPDVSLTIAPWILGVVGREASPESSAPMLGAMLAMAAYQIELRVAGSPRDRDGERLAGLQGAVRWYSSLLAARWIQRNDSLDSLAGITDTAQQARWIAEHSAPSSPPSSDAPAASGSPSDLAGCESVSTDFPRPTDARGTPIEAWDASGDDRVAVEGDAIEREFERVDEHGLAALVERARTFASAHRGHPYADFVLGIALRASHDLTRAETTFSRLLAQRPGFFRAEYEYAVVLHYLHRQSDATMHFARVAAIQPRFANAHFNAGVGQYNSGDFSAALSHWCAARRLQPTDFGPAQKVVQALHALGRFDEAERARAVARAINAQSADPNDQRMGDYIIDRLRVGEETVFVYEVLRHPREDLRYHYLFECHGPDDAVRRTVTLESSIATRAAGTAALIGAMLPDHTHMSGVVFREMPSYRVLRPRVVEIIEQLQRGSTESFGAMSRPSP